MTLGNAISPSGGCATVTEFFHERKGKKRERLQIWLHVVLVAPLKDTSQGREGGHNFTMAQLL